MPSESQWIKVAQCDDFAQDMGGCVTVKNTQIAIFNVNNKTDWYAVSNHCPHQQLPVLSRGLSGQHAGEPTVACPMHKRIFSLDTGHCLSDSNTTSLTCYPVKCEGSDILVQVDHDN